jgi:hypothetical protein
MVHLRNRSVDTLHKGDTDDLIIIIIIPTTVITSAVDSVLQILNLNLLLNLKRALSSLLQRQ